MMKKRWITMIGSAVLGASIAVTGVSFAQSHDNEVHSGTIQITRQSEADFPALAKLTLAQAIQKASAKVPGQVLRTDLGDENGFLVYEIEMVGADRSIVDVKVDAGSGKVLAMNLDKADRENNEQGENEDGDHEDGEHGNEG